VSSAGCARKLDTDYGQRKGTATYSVNGTAVLADMFEAAGHDVYSWRWLSPRVQDRADCIVWFPNDFEPPSEEVREWLDDWLLGGSDDLFSDLLEEQPGRTLIYVCRDFDAAAWYWEKVKPDAPPEQVKQVEKAAAAAQNDFDVARQAIPAEQDCQWFTVQGKSKPRQVRSLQGPWAEGIDAAEVEIELNGRIKAADTAEVLLKSDGDVLVTRQEHNGSQLIVVANGSFLLNLPLVNQEHRKLAGRLIDQIGPPRQTVVFLESDPGGPPIRDEDPSAQVPTGMEIFLAGRPAGSSGIWPPSGSCSVSRGGRSSAWLGGYSRRAPPTSASTWRPWPNCWSDPATAATPSVGWHITGKPPRAANNDEGRMQKAE
jgi:hypothetical protein